MKNFKYEIKYNDEGRPYIHLDDVNLDTEHRFACIEITKYILFSLLETDKFTEKQLLDLAVAGDVVNSISDSVAELIKGQNNTLNDINDLLNNNEE